MKSSKMVRFRLTLSVSSLAVFQIISPLLASAQPDPNWIPHDRSRPQPPPVTPATPSLQEKPGKPPSDATVLFDGKDLSSWVSMDGSPTKWTVKDGVMECVQGSGYIRTLQSFGDCQLHLEWAAPTPVEGEGQGRGNSGLFFGLNRYEVQILDSFNSRTYADGGAASVYGQYPPLVNASLPPGQWQTYDIIYTAPRFDATGKLSSPARLTVFHNGVLVQNNVELTGPTSWLERAPYQFHEQKQPIALQDHGNPVRFRNIWVRELKPGKKEFMFPASFLERYTGKFGQLEIVRDRNQLLAVMGGVRIPLYAETPTRFFGKSVDLQVEFPSSTGSKADRVVWSVGEGGTEASRSE